MSLNWRMPLNTSTVEPKESSSARANAILRPLACATHARVVMPKNAPTFCSSRPIELQNAFSLASFSGETLVALR